jgi:hypothetical protein
MCAIRLASWSTFLLTQKAIDLTRSNTYRIEMMFPSWTGYLLQRERLTKAEQDTIKKVWRLHVGEDVPEERYYLCANRELDAGRTTVVTLHEIRRLALSDFRGSLFFA